MPRINNMRTPQEKELIILEWKHSGMGTKKFSNLNGIAYSVLCRWIKKYDEKGIDGLISNTGKNKGENRGRPKKARTREEQ